MSECVLVVDDEKNMRLSLKTVLTVKTNSRTTPILRLPVNGKVVIPPAMKVTPNVLAKTLLPTQSEIENLTVSNAGQADLTWKAEILTDADPQTGPPLDAILSRLNTRHNGLTERIPNVNDFTEGIEGHGISDGGNGLYNFGNIFRFFPVRKISIRHGFSVLRRINCTWSHAICPHAFFIPIGIYNIRQLYQ